MNNGIKKKLEELIGKEVNIYHPDYGIRFVYPYEGHSDSQKGEILRFEEDDCILVKSVQYRGINDIFSVLEMIIPIDSISNISTRIDKEKG